MSRLIHIRSFSRWPAIPAVVCLIIFMVGCGSAPPVIDLPAPRALGRDLATDQAGEVNDVASGDTPTLESPRGTLTLRNALALALASNPELNASAREVHARRAEIRQAGLAPNPELSLEVENFAGSGELSGLDAIETTVGVSQLFELGDKRGKRRRVADHDHGLAAWDLETQRLDLITGVTHAFYNILAAQERVRLSESLITVAEQTVTSVARRVGAGALSPVEETRARIELATNQVELDLARRVLTVARMQLASTWGDTTALFDQAAGPLAESLRVPAWQTLIDHLDNNPDLARWETEIDQRQAVLALERSLRLPDVSVGGGVRWWRESGDKALLLEVAMPLPMFDRNKGATRAAEHRLAMSTEQLRAGRVHAHTLLTAAYEELVATTDEAATLRDEILPDAADAAATARRSYAQGLFSLTDVFDIQRALFELRSRLIDTLVRYHLAVAEIERLTGEPFENLVQTDKEG